MNYHRRHILYYNVYIYISKISWSQISIENSRTIFILCHLVHGVFFQLDLEGVSHFNTFYVIWDAIPQSPAHMVETRLAIETGDTWNVVIWNAAPS